MQITDIKRQQKRDDRYSVYADGRYLFSLSEAGLLQLDIRIGKTFDEAELMSARSGAMLDKLYDLSLRYVALRLRSEWEMATYLKRKEASPADAQTIMDRLHNYGWLNDEKFAQAWVSDRNQRKPSSQRRLRYELQAKHVATETIDKVLQEEAVSDLETLRSVAAKKQHQSRYAADPQKLMQYLARQGYSYTDIKTVLGSAGAEDL